MFFDRSTAFGVGFINLRLHSTSRIGAKPCLEETDGTFSQAAICLLQKCMVAVEFVVSKWRLFLSC